jgi:polar amino acid transport system substrate-binding protein
MKIFEKHVSNFLTASFLFASSGDACGEQKIGPPSDLNIFQLVTEENPPYQFLDSDTGSIVGINIKPIDDLFRKAKIKYKMTILPWARAYSYALKKPNYGVFGTARTKKREELFEWIGPLSKARWVLFSKPYSDIKIEKFADLKKYRIGGYVDDGRTKFLEQRGIKVHTVDNNALNIRKLMKGRIDLWVSGDLTGRKIARENGVKGLNEVYVIKEVSIYIAINKKSSKRAIESLKKAARNSLTNGQLVEQ